MTNVERKLTYNPFTGGLPRASGWDLLADKEYLNDAQTRQFETMDLGLHLLAKSIEINIGLLQCHIRLKKSFSKTQTSDFTDEIQKIIISNIRNEFNYREKCELFVPIQDNYFCRNFANEQWQGIWLPHTAPKQQTDKFSDERKSSRKSSPSNSKQLMFLELELTIEQQNIFHRFYARVQEKLLCKFLFYSLNSKHLLFVSRGIDDLWKLLRQNHTLTDYKYFVEITNYIMIENQMFINFLMESLYDKDLINSIDHFKACIIQTSYRQLEEAVLKEIIKNDNNEDEIFSNSRMMDITKKLDRMIKTMKFGNRDSLMEMFIKARKNQNESDFQKCSLQEQAFLNYPNKYVRNAFYTAMLPKGSSIANSKTPSPLESAIDTGRSVSQLQDNSQELLNELESSPQQQEEQNYEASNEVINRLKRVSYRVSKNIVRYGAAGNQGLENSKKRSLREQEKISEMEEEEQASIPNNQLVVPVFDYLAKEFLLPRNSTFRNSCLSASQNQNVIRKSEKRPPKNTPGRRLALFRARSQFFKMNGPLLGMRHKKKSSMEYPWNKILIDEMPTAETFELMDLRIEGKKKSSYQDAENEETQKSITIGFDRMHLSKTAKQSRVSMLLKNSMLLKDGLVLKNGMIFKDGMLFKDGVMIKDGLVLKDGRLFKNGVLMKSTVEKILSSHDKRQYSVGVEKLIHEDVKEVRRRRKLSSNRKLSTADLLNVETLENRKSKSLWQLQIPSSTNMPGSACASRRPCAAAPRVAQPVQSPSEMQSADRKISLKVKSETTKCSSNWESLNSRNWAREVRMAREIRKKPNSRIRFNQGSGQNVFIWSN